MKKIIITFLSLIITLSAANAQKGINFSYMYAGGNKLLMCVDSAAKNVYYQNVFPNQPYTSFNYLPEINNINIQINFRKTDSVQHYRYTIMLDNKPIALNKSIDITRLKDTHAGGDEEVFRSTTFGTFPIKDKIITIITYDIQKPLEIYKSIFYGKPLPKAKIEVFAKRFATKEGVDYSYMSEPKEKVALTFTEKDDELIVVKERTDIDYLYYTSIKDKKTNKIIFESTSWLYEGYINEAGKLSPFVKVDKSIFKKSGDYEIIIQPLIKWSNCSNCDISQKDIEEYTARYTLVVILDNESYTKKELIIYGLIICAILGAIGGAALAYIKKKEAKKLVQQFKETEIAKFQLNSIRSQLNPHFLFNSLAGIQNLMNKNEVDNANKYLSKFARLTRNVLYDDGLISLSQEKSLLDDYLQMELLRFGFQYEINHSGDLDLANIEIPSMLLQPFVENAVKHGISQKATAGKVIIEFIKQANDLILTVTDNGNGFDTNKKYNGLGIPLSDSRIALLNNVYKENRFTLSMQSTTNGTKIELRLTDWL